MIYYMYIYITIFWKFRSKNEKNTEMLGDVIHYIHTFLMIISMDNITNYILFSYIQIVLSFERPQPN